MMDDANVRIASNMSAIADQLVRRSLSTSPPQPPCFVGRVYAIQSVPSTADAYFAVHPVSVLGTEAEGNPGALVVNSSATAFVYVIGPSAPKVGDDLVCRFIGNRWVADKSAGSSRVTIAIPGCMCASTPTVLHMVSSKPSSNDGMFQSCTIAYGPTPAELSDLAIGDYSFLSVESFQDQETGDYFRYLFNCGANLYGITRVYADSILGSPFKDVLRYTWLINYPGNTCIPFLLSAGNVYPGGDATCIVTISE
jgi:hypothetical protein